MSRSSKSVLRICKNHRHVEISTVFGLSVISTMNMLDEVGSLPLRHLLLACQVCSIVNVDTNTHEVYGNRV